MSNGKHNYTIHKSVDGEIVGAHFVLDNAMMWAKSIHGFVYDIRNKVWLDSKGDKVK